MRVLTLAALASISMVTAVAQMPTDTKRPDFSPLGIPTIPGIWLLDRSDVKKDLRLSPKQSAVVGKEVGGYLSASKNSAARPDLARVEAALKSTLTPSQLGRLKQLELQRQGGFALCSKTIADKLGLTATQSAKLTKVRIEGFKKHQEAEKKFSPGKYKADPKIVEWIRQNLVAVLTPAQKKKWDAMLGKPIHWSD